jgi:hypothetical protein
MKNLMERKIVVIETKTPLMETKTTQGVSENRSHGNADDCHGSENPSHGNAINRHGSANDTGGLIKSLSWKRN